MSTAVGIFDVTGTTHQVALVQSFWGRLTSDPTAWVAGRVKVVFTASTPTFRYGPHDVHEVPASLSRSSRTLKLRHGAKGAPNLTDEGAQYWLGHELEHLLDYEHIDSADRSTIMGLLGVTDFAGHVLKRWRSDPKGYWWLPEEDAAHNFVLAFTDIDYASPENAYRRVLTGADLATLHTVYATATGGDGGDGGDPPPGGTGDPPADGSPVGTGASYKPVLRSQFDYTGQYGDNYPDERMLTINGHNAAYWFGKNCTFAAGAMAMDRHTTGGQRPTPNQLRAQTSEASAKGGSLQDVRHAWSNASLIDASWADQTFEVASPDTWDHFLSQIKSGRGAVVEGFLPAIQTKYKCQPGTGYRGAHSIFVNEWKSDGHLLVYDPLCRPSDNLGGYVDRGALDSAFASYTSEAQPRWIPVDQVKAYAESWFGLTSGGRPRKPNHVSAGYTKAVTAAEVQAPDLWACYSDGSWKETVVPASTPQDVERVQRTWETSDFWDGAYGLGVVAFPDPDIVIQGEEGRVGDWQPTQMGYGVRGQATYLSSSSSEGVKSRKKGWYLHPWDIPADYFAVDPPDWPEGRAYLQRAVDKFNREVGAQAFEVVNRGDLWSDVRLGGVYTLSLGLQGPAPDGLYGKVRVVAFIPDEDSGTMQVLAEWLGEPDEPADEHPPLDDPVEDVVLRARQYLGTRYRGGGEGDPGGAGVDCSGLVFREFTDTGHGDLIGGTRRLAAGYTRYFANLGRFFTDESVAERGDLIAYEHHNSTTHKVVHIALYLGNGKCISALVNPHGVSRHGINALDVDFHAVLKPAYNRVTTTAQLSAALDDDPEEGADATVVLDPGDDDFVIASDPWA